MINVLSLMPCFTGERLGDRRRRQAAIPGGKGAAAAVAEEWSGGREREGGGGEGRGRLASVELSLHFERMEEATKLATREVSDTVIIQIERRCRIHTGSEYVIPSPMVRPLTRRLFGPGCPGRLMELYTVGCILFLYSCGRSHLRQFMFLRDNSRDVPWANVPWAS